MSAENQKCECCGNVSEHLVRLCRGCAESEAAAPTGYAIPEAMFSCSNDYCRVECSYPASMLHWYENERRWVCENCWDDLDYENEGEDRPERGITLEKYIQQQKLTAADLLHNDRTGP